MSDVIDFRSRRTFGVPDPSDSYRRMTAARQAFIAEWIAWLRHGAPVREDALLEADGTAGQMRQLAQLNTSAGHE